MSSDEILIDIAPRNGVAARPVSVVHRTGGEFRDVLNPNSAIQRVKFVNRVAEYCGFPVTELEWMHGKLVEAADAVDRENCKPKGSERADKECKSTADLLVELALERYRIGRTETDDAFAVQRDGPNVALMFRGSKDALRCALARTFRERYGRTANSTAMADALTTLQGEAYCAKPESVHLRIAEHNKDIVIDMGDATGRAIVVSAEGWKVVDRSPVLFWHTATTGATATPEHGGRLSDLRGLLNVTDETWPLVLGWLLAALVPSIPHPILLLGGQQGSGKTNSAKQLIGLVDPSPAPLRSQPRDPETWAMLAAGSWALAIDNISAISDWWSDSLCKAVTGDGWVRRKLYTDSELAVLSFRRVILLTSIDPGALRGDLGDRVLLVDQEPIDESIRLAQRDIDRRYDEARPLLFGALLDLLSAVWRVLPSVHLARLPRMADFGRLLAAMDLVLADDADNCSLNIYLRQRERIAESVIESDLVALSIRSLVQGGKTWEGSPAQLCDAVLPDKPPKGWPRTPQVLGGRIARLTPALRQIGIVVTKGRDGHERHRWYRIEDVGGKQLSALSASSATPEKPHNYGLLPQRSVVDSGQSPESSCPQGRQENARENGSADDAGDADNDLPSLSSGWGEL